LANRLMTKFAKWIVVNSGLANPDTWFTESLGGNLTSTGIRVNENTAMNSTAVYACVRILAESIASLPLPVYKRNKGGEKERDPTHPLYTVLHDQANTEMTAFTLKELLMSHLCTWGNAYAEIEWDGAGRIKGLWPLPPDKTWPERNPSTKLIEYKTILSDGSGVTLSYDRVFHIPGLGSDGLVGYSPIRMSREAIGLSLAAEEFGSRFFGNGAQLSGVLEHPGKLGDKAVEHLRESFEEKYTGLSRAHRLMILEEGMKYNRIGIPPEDAQFLETRKFQLNEIARIFRVPPHLIGDLDRATFSNIEHQSIEFVVHTLRPWLVRWEQAIIMKLLTPLERRRFFAEFVVDGLLRGDVKSRYDAYAVGRQNGWLSANDIRNLENMNPIDGGDAYLVNGNMMPVDQAGLEGGES
jgi:HK97 family phage portal protein